jgi:hypothetical protein
VELRNGKRAGRDAEIVLHFAVRCSFREVRQDSTGIYFGVLLIGPGTVWLNGVKLEAIGSDVPTTQEGSMKLRDEPTNLDFEEQ